MTDDRERMKAIFETLKASIQSGLNASLSPDDCRELLRMFTLINMRNTIQSVPTAPAPAPRARGAREPSPVEKIVNGVAELAHGVIEDLAGEVLKPAGRPAKSRRRRT